MASRDSRKLILEHLIDVKDDGSFRLNQDYFGYCTGLTMTNARFDAIFGGPPRRASEPLEQRHMDLAASVQAVTEEVVLRLTRALASESGLRNLCLAGGVALNCVANGKILRDGKFDEIFVQPAAGDAGGALGAALAVYFQENQGVAVKNAKRPDAMHGAYLGPSYAQSEIEDRLKAAGAVFTVVDDAQLIEKTAAALAAGQAVGWHQGRMEFGPRALGNRSILGDPRSPTMQKALNLKVKYRESFRPFAPSVLREKVADWFELDADSPYMLLVAPVKAAAVPQDVGGGACPFRHRQAERAAIGHSGRHPCRLFGPRADRAPRDQPALPRADHALRGADRLPCAHQHKL